MKITILTVGSRGDVQPYIALALGLQGAGHDVLLASNENFCAFVTGYGIPFFALTGNSEALVQDDLGRKAIESGRNYIKLARTFRAMLNNVLEPFLADCIVACKDADVVIHSLLGFFAQQVAEQRGIPSIGAYLQPVARTTAFPNIAVPFQSLGKPLNWLTHLAGEQVFWQAFRPIVNNWRTQTLGLPAINAFPGAFHELLRDHYPIIHGLSPTTIPKPHNWHEHLHMTGFWFLDAPNEWRPPDELTEFLEAGKPPVYVGFGSMSSRDPAATTRIVVEALQQADQRGILLSGWGGDG